MPDQPNQSDPTTAPYDVPLRVTLKSGHVTTATRKELVGWQGKVAPIPEDGIVKWERVEDGEKV